MGRMDQSHGGNRCGGDLLVECLARRGGRHLFGMPGSHSTAVYDALQRHGGIGTVLVRNEQAGAFAADGYARATGRPGVVCTTAGPGATNALTGVAEAWADSVPILLLAGQVNADRMHLECGAYHEIDLEGLFRPVTKWRGTVRAVDEIPGLVRRAFEAMTTGRPRPAALFLPQDLMARECPIVPEGSAPSPDAVEAPKPPEIPSGAIEAAAALLARAGRPILLAGGGALWSGAGDEVRELARRLDAPVITTLNGKGLLDERDPASLGHARSAQARAALPHADAMLAVGCRFTEVMTDWHRMPVPKDLVQIDLDADQVGMNYPVAVGIVADAKAALEALLRTLPVEGRTSRWARSGSRPATLAQHGPSGSSRPSGPCSPMRPSCSPTPARWAIACTPTGPPQGLARSSTRRTTSAWAGASPRRSERPSHGRTVRSPRSAATAAL